MNKLDEGIMTEPFDTTPIKVDPRESGIGFAQGCMNVCLLELAGLLVLGLLVALFMGLPEIVAAIR